MDARGGWRHVGGLVVLLGAFALTRTAAAQEDDYEAWLRQQRAEYNEYVDAQEEAFLQFLERDWASVSVNTATGTPLDDKPRRVPTVGERPSGGSAEAESDRPVSPAPPSRREASEGAEEAEREPARRPSDQGPTEPSTSPRPAEDAPSDAAAVNREASLSFFGTATTVPYGDALRPRLDGAPTPSSIRAFWKKMAEAPHAATLDALQERRETLELSDWGYYRYLRTLSARLYDPSAANDRALWTWFMLMKSGYAARVGYSDDAVVLMLPMNERLFDRPQLRIDGQRYYLMADAGGSLRTYEGRAPGERAPLRLHAETLPAVPEARATRAVSFTSHGRRHELEVAYNPQAVDYLAGYPDVELHVLFESGLSSTAEAALTDALGPLVADRDPRAAVNGLLTFAQFATGYKRDRDHFGEERFLFPEESLASDYSDCEDRAVLLAALVRTILDRPVVGLQWPNHVALAVRAGDGLSSTAEDQMYTVDGHTYILADPTYIGSSLGMVMPLVEGEAPEVITLDR